MPVDSRIEDVIEPFPISRNRVPLSESHPEIAVFWCHKKNCGFGPEDFTAGSHVKAWWICVQDNSHVFQQMIKSRVVSERNGTSGHGCIYCRGLRPADSNSLGSLFPEIAKEWMTEKNGISPDQVVAKSALLGWWKCSTCGCEWQTQLVNRTVKGSGCHYCAGQKVGITNSLASLFPEIASEWYQPKNGTVTPSDVTCGSGNLFYWICKKNPKHIWQASVQARAHRGSGCWKCSRSPTKTTEDRMKLVFQLLKEGRTKEQVASIIGVQKSTIFRALKRYKTHGY